MTERLFLAIPITNTLRERLRELQEISLQTLKDHGIDNARPENLNNSHITIRFLGEVNGETLQRLKEEMEQITFGQQSFNFCLDTINVFDSPRKARVLWAGVDQLQGFRLLRNEIDEMLERVGFDREGEFFTPHLTLLRFREVQNLSECFDELKQLADVCSIERYPVEEVALYSSKLSPHGATHTKRASTKLRGALG